MKMAENKDKNGNTKLFIAKQMERFRYLCED